MRLGSTDICIYYTIFIDEILIKFVTMKTIPNFQIHITVVHILHSHDLDKSINNKIEECSSYIWSYNGP
jgi:hypothetical protein